MQREEREEVAPAPEDQQHEAERHEQATITVQSEKALVDRVARRR